MSKKPLSKAFKKSRKAKEKAWKDKVLSFKNKHDNYYRRVLLLDNNYLSEFDDGTVEIYTNIGNRPTLDYGVCYHVVLRGQYGTPIIAKWFYPPKETFLEDVWKEACAKVDEIADKEIIDNSYLKNQSFVWD